MKQDSFHFEATIWKYEGPNGWYFASVPKDLSRKIRKQYQESEEGWGENESSSYHRANTLGFFHLV